MPTFDVFGIPVDITVNEGAFKYYARLRKVHEFVERSYMRPISLREAAAVANHTETYFSRFFHQKTGTRFKAWLIAIRVHYAIRFLAESNLPHQVVARKAGFGSRRAFERALLKVTGMTASEIKRKVSVHDG